MNEKEKGNWWWLWTKVTDVVGRGRSLPFSRTRIISVADVSDRLLRASLLARPAFFSP